MRINLSPLLIGIALFLASSPEARAIDLGVKLGGAEAGVSVGGDSSLGVKVEIGGSGAAIHLGGSLDADLSVDSNGDGRPDAAAAAPKLTPLEQQGALEAVKSRRALPLEDILTRARLIAEGDVIDARLIQVRRTLLYEIKMLEPSGNVRDLYFYARSGAFVAPK